MKELLKKNSETLKKLLRKNSESLSIVKCFITAFIICGAIQAQIMDIPNDNLNFRMFIDGTTASSPEPSFGIPNNNQSQQDIYNMIMSMPAPSTPNSPNLQMGNSYSCPISPMVSTIPNENRDFMRHIDTLITPVPIPQVTSTPQYYQNNMSNNTQQVGVPNNSPRPTMSPFHHRDKNDWVVGPRTMDYETRRQYLKDVYDIY